MASDKKVAGIVHKLRSLFPSFGGGMYDPRNPISVALAEQPAMFAGGVSIEEVVRVVLAEVKR